MKAFRLNRADRLTVYDSERKPIAVERGGIIETNDPKLAATLKSDFRFSEVQLEPISTKAETPNPPVIEQFTTEPPKELAKPKKRGRPRLIR